MGACVCECARRVTKTEKCFGVATRTDPAAVWHKHNLTNGNGLDTGKGTRGTNGRPSPPRSRSVSAATAPPRPTDRPDRGERRSTRPPSHPHRRAAAGTHTDYGGRARR